MIWFYLLAPVFLLTAIAFYFDKKHGATAIDETKKAEKVREYPPEHFHSNGPNP